MMICRLLFVRPLAVWLSVDFYLSVRPSARSMVICRLEYRHHSYSVVTGWPLWPLILQSHCCPLSLAASPALRFNFIITHFNFYITPLLVCRKLAGAAFEHRGLRSSRPHIFYSLSPVFRITSKTHVTGEYDYQILTQVQLGSDCMLPDFFPQYAMSHM